MPKLPHARLLPRPVCMIAQFCQEKKKEIVSSLLSLSLAHAHTLLLSLDPIKSKDSHKLGYAGTSEYIFDPSAVEQSFSWPNEWGLFSL